MGCCFNNKTEENTSSVNSIEQYIRLVLSEMKLCDITFDQYIIIVNKLIMSEFGKDTLDKFITESFVNVKATNAHMDSQLVLVDDFDISKNAVLDMYAWGFSFLRKQKSAEECLLKIIKIYRNITYESDLQSFKNFLLKIS